MTDHTDEYEQGDYEEVAAHAEAGRLRLVKGTVRQGADAAAAGQAALLAATGATTLEDATGWRSGDRGWGRNVDPRQCGRCARRRSWTTSSPRMCDGTGSRSSTWSATR